MEEDRVSANKECIVRLIEEPATMPMVMQVEIILQYNSSRIYRFRFAFKRISILIMSDVHFK